jgi:homocysteine S-methyltransferase
MPGCDLDEQPGDSRGTVRQLVDGLLAPGGDALAQVDGIGVNCTHPSYLPSLTRDLTREINTYWTNLDAPRKTLKLLLYPDGGKEWDPIARKFKPGGTSIDEWVTSVKEAVFIAGDTEHGSGIWDEAIVGGCCNTYPEHIRLLGDLC